MTSYAVTFSSFWHQKELGTGVGKEPETWVFWAGLALAVTEEPCRSVDGAGLSEEWWGVGEGGSNKPAFPSPLGSKVVESTVVWSQAHLNLKPCSAFSSVSFAFTSLSLFICTMGGHADGACPVVLP